MLTPFPGLPLYKDLEKQRRIFNTDWEKYGFHQPVVFHPKKLTETELMKGYKKSYKKYYSWNAIAKRFHYLLQNHLTLTNIVMFISENFFIRASVMNQVKKR